MTFCRDISEVRTDIIYMDTINEQLYSAIKKQKAVSDYFTIEQILPFGFAEQYCLCEW